MLVLTEKVKPELRGKMDLKSKIGHQKKTPVLLQSNFTNVNVQVVLSTHIHMSYLSGVSITLLNGATRTQLSFSTLNLFLSHAVVYLAISAPSQFSDGPHAGNQPQLLGDL